MQKIKIDFANPGLPQHLNTMEDDSQSRFFEATLYENGKAYEAPSGATYSIMYRGFGPQNQGWYDTINDGAGKRAACTVSGNVVTCEIARQALQVPGHVNIVLCVSAANGYMLKSWSIDCDNRNDHYDDTAEVASFFYITQVSNANWTQAIQAWEDLKSTIDPTLSISGKAADAKAAGNAIEAEKSRATNSEASLDKKKADKTDLDVERKRIDALNNGGLNLKDEIIDTSIKAWLTEHPEATTTVQDNSLIEEKFTEELKLHTLKDYVTPEMFGGIGDGKTDDTDAIISALNTKKSLYINGGKIYIINSPINVDKGACIYGTGIIKAGPSFVGEALILIGFNSYTNGLLNGVENQLVSNKIIVDCSNLDNVDGIRIKASYKVKYDISVRNCKATGVHCGFDYNSNYYAENIYDITGQNDYNTICDRSLLVYAEGSDDIFNNITGCNFHTFVYSYGGYNVYGIIHGYIVIDELFDNSVLFLTRVGFCDVDFIYCDGLETAIKIELICHSLNVKNCYINVNKDVLKRGNVLPLQAHTNETYGFADGSIYYSNSENTEIHINQKYYDAPFAGLNINANKLSWTSTTGDTSCLFQTDKVCIGTVLNGETGLTQQSDKLPENYTGYFIIATCKRIIDNWCLQEFINVNGEEFFKTCVESHVDNPAANFDVTKWHKM